MSLTTLYLYLICLNKQVFSAKYNKNDLEVKCKEKLVKSDFAK